MPRWLQDSSAGNLWLFLGGVAYISGLIFFHYDGVRIPYGHAIWHMHVCAGVAAHYAAVHAYLLDKTPLIDGGLLHVGRIEL